MIRKLTHVWKWDSAIINIYLNMWSGFGTVARDWTTVEKHHKESLSVLEKNVK